MVTIKLKVLLEIYYCVPRYCEFTTDITIAMKYHLAKCHCLKTPCGLPKLHYAVSYEGCSESNASYFISTISEADAGGMVVEVEPSHQYSITFYGCESNSSTGAVWQMASDMEMHMRQRDTTEFICAEIMAPSTFINAC